MKTRKGWGVALFLTRRTYSFWGGAGTYKGHEFRRLEGHPFPHLAMVKNPTLRTNFLALSEYVASATFLSTTAWKREGIADVLVNKADGGTKTCVLVGEVVDDRLLCGPNGNHVGRGEYAKPFEAARFSLFLARPQWAGFAEDFDVAQAKIADVEEKVSLTADHRYFREVSGLNKTFKLAAPLFEERVSSP